jgi:hypothetical protein
MLLGRMAGAVEGALKGSRKRSGAGAAGTEFSIGPKVEVLGRNLGAVLKFGTLLAGATTGASVAAGGSAAGFLWKNGNECDGGQVAEEKISSPQ